MEDNSESSPRHTIVGQLLSGHQGQRLHCLIVIYSGGRAICLEDELSKHTFYRYRNRNEHRYSFPDMASCFMYL